MSQLTPGRALDVGCGEGADAVWLASHGWTVTAVEVSQVALTRAGLRAQEAAVQVRWVHAGLVNAELAPAGRAVAAIMATLAELELGRERRAPSRQSRRGRQLPASKPTTLTVDRQEQLRRLAATGEPVRELAAAVGIGRATAYRYLKDA
ncbi:hypothetical protein TUM20983_36710 [Mycobacterium antarcticum]|uniref:methyltransferase domain-containing protein n=1 Tax=Mycolicibacterium sp. TUM20983 TaxID=3023369 RepID=UPI002394EC66|nr:methyltransferase domain-containing protein [Mycolicibacterium sp. TUM20983]GLP76561.1 hypothetical protein TUM20983_36710 [Mycolicibacterium sp. TUM20983]